MSITVTCYSYLFLKCNAVTIFPKKVTSYSNVVTLAVTSQCLVGRFSGNAGQCLCMMRIPMYALCIALKCFGNRALFLLTHILHPVDLLDLSVRLLPSLSVFHPLWQIGEHLVRVWFPAGSPSESTVL